MCHDVNPTSPFIAAVLFTLVGGLWLSASPVFAKKVPPPLHSVNRNTPTEKQLE
jgi:hypothetical protein